MKNIGDFFKKIGGIQAKEIALRASIQASVKEFVDIDIPLGSIVCKTGTVSLKGISHSARSAIFIHKQKIIDCANKTQTDQKIIDIR
ncbi:MAG TPA: hypothetical protein VL335_00365 [Candidatus Paceibacterota bacterium]|jgi:hypothetical protein|nr:hypothetical protein [Candidatus Paceibacterota bacterium]